MSPIRTVTSGKARTVIFFIIAAGACIFSVLWIFSQSDVIKYVSDPVTNALFPSRREATLMFVGDIMLSRAIGSRMEKEGDWAYHFLHIAPFLREADFLFGNLESPLSDKGVKSGSMYSFRANPKSIEGLLYAGFDAVSFANNHSYDYGPEALLDTVNLLKANNIGVAGAGEDYASAHLPFIAWLKDGTELALFAYTNLIPMSLGEEDARPAIAYLDTTKAVSEIAEAKRHADIVIVSLHWGNEYESESNDYQKNIAHALVDAGADFVIGHHPHVIQETEKYKNGFIAYSLGNFIFDQNFSPETGEGLIVSALLKKGAIDSIQTRKVVFNETYQPNLVPE